MQTCATPLTVIETVGFEDYRLLDSGAGRKLERFASIVVDRPEPQALWQPHMSQREWGKAHAVFSASHENEEKGKWRIDRPVPESWPVRIALPSPLSGGVGAGENHNSRSGIPPSPTLPHEGGGGSAARVRSIPPPSWGRIGGGDSRSSAEEKGVTMLCRLQGLWHVGLFPEHLPHWEWMLERLGAIKNEPPRVLNLFAYTGAASLLAAAAGAEVTHVDASKKAIQWAKENQSASGLSDAPIRWILDDAAKFAGREIRRGKTYHVIIVDPPKFGRGPEGEVWDLFRNLPALMQDCARLLAPSGASLVLTVYAIRASALAFDQLMRETLRERGGSFSSGELAIRAQGGGHAVPTSLFTRWTSG